jgi:endo-1,3(4)-beta-glucanase
MGSLNSSFVDNYGPFVDNLLFDVAYHGNSDSATVDDIFFPLARHKSWYDGHSFGSGLDPFANGKSQEGSSEAVNCYYGAYLWSLIRKSNSLTQSVDMVDYARLLLATEIRGAKTYWHMTPTRGTLWNRTTSLWPAIYDDTFASSYMVGNIGMLDAVSSTWFGNAPLLVHMINFMPATAITNELFSTQYVEQEYTNVIVPLHSNISNAWKGYALCDHAIIDPSVAWLEAQSLVSAELDSALSKSQVLYWISSHSRFNYTGSSDDDRPVIDRFEDKASNSSGILSSSCEDNADCALLGLTGFCCPTGKGSILGCCDDF